MNRKKKLVMNTIMAALNQIITMICGLILPPLIIKQYSSETNGLVSSITQFLAFFSLMEMGIGATVRASLYKPLAYNDSDEVSRILISSKRFFLKLGLFLCVYCIILMIYFPLCVDHSIGYLSTMLLVIAIAFSALSNYFFGIVYQQLLNADQQSYIQLAAAMISTIVNTVLSVVLIKLRFGIEIVKLVSSIVLLIRPIILKIYVDSHYELNFKLKLSSEPIKQKWNGLTQHIAVHILKHVDVVVLTFFSTLSNVSIYYVYNLVASGLQQMVEVLTTGMGALMGDLYARSDKENLIKTFSAFELTIHIIVTVLYTIAIIMIIPFVRIYTSGINDANYIVPAFGYLLIIANGTYCLRMPYYILVQNAGHFKQTQNSAIIEAVLNVVISVVLVKKYGLIGVAIGTLCAMAYRTVYLACYLRNNIIHRKLCFFVKHIIIDIVCVVVCIYISRIINISVSTWKTWFFSALKTGVLVSIVVFFINCLLYKNDIKYIMQLFF